MMRFLTATRADRCYRCDAAIAIGDRIMWDFDHRVAAHEKCATCVGCHRPTDDLREGRCSRCFSAWFATTPDGMAAAAERRAHGAAKAVATRRARKAIRECDHANAEVIHRADGGVPRVCACGRSRMEMADGSVLVSANFTYDWGWND